ncbi:MAG: GWxTD domain-containing protein [Acidobacteria bacterium]|nr:GWxTD domain-containing protein [Acidobacteriota bacterium]
MRRHYLFALLSLSVALTLTTTSRAQQGEIPKASQKAHPAAGDTPQREQTNKERQKREKALRKELQPQYKRLLDEDLTYIISPEERAAFLHLSTDEEREQFIEQFWLRRDPTPDTVENEFREEHYRRIAYANERFSSGRPGWMTDRGHIYILHGPPNEVESHPTGGIYYQSPEEGRESMAVYPYELWRYSYLEGIGNNTTIEFVDLNGTGDYRLTTDPYEKQVSNTPGALTRSTDPLLATDQNARFRLQERQMLYAKIQRPPEVKFKDLEALVTSRLVFGRLPFDLRMDFIRITDETLLVPITLAIDKKNLAFALKNEVHRAVVNVFGRVTTPTGRIAQTFEDVVELDIPAALFASALNQPAVYQKALPLRSGLYKLTLVLKDLNSGNVGLLERRVAVPQFEANQLTHSSLILADLIQSVPSKELGQGQFVIGSTKVRPVVNRQFKRDARLGIYMQVYNLGLNEATHKPDATIRYTVFRDGQAVFNQEETTAQLKQAGQQATFASLLSLQSFPGGRYLLMVTVTDRTLGQTIQTSANFQVLP